MYGFIYKLCCDEHSDIYIGHSTTTPSQRLYSHKKDKLKCCASLLSSSTLKLVVLEYCEVPSRHDLLVKERWYIENTPNCINTIKRPIISASEQRETQKRNNQNMRLYRFEKKKQEWEEKYENKSPTE